MSNLPQRRVDARRPRVGPRPAGWEPLAPNCKLKIFLLTFQLAERVAVVTGEGDSAASNFLPEPARWE